MSTPVIEAIDNVNNTSLETVFAAVAADPTARDNLSQSDRNIDAVSTNVSAIEGLDTNEDAILRVLCRREGFDPANFADLDEVASNQTLMQAIAARQETSKILARSGKASSAAAISQTAMVEIANSSTSRSEIISSATALSNIQTVDQAIVKIVAAEAGLNASNYADMAALTGDAADMQTVAGSGSAMDRLVDSQTAMSSVASSSTAMGEFADSTTAMQKIASSQTAMDEVAASQTAIDVIGDATNQSIIQDTVLDSATAAQSLTASPLEQTFSRSFGNTFFGGNGDITTERVIVTSTNVSGTSCEIDFELQGDGTTSDVQDSNKTVISDGVRTDKGGRRTQNGGSGSISGIIIN
jgi:hypothetical protein